MENAPGPAIPARPRNVVVVLLDSLNRHMLGSYGGKEFATPNLDAFAANALRFEKHYAGSLPCMPARHDILCGALDFLWRPWGSIEIWEDAITYHLHRAGVVSQLISDHPHLFELGGENYHTDFSAWDYQRGHEGDLWKTRPDPSWMGAPGFGRGWMPYDSSRGYFRGEEDFPGPKTMAAAARWVDENAGAHDRFFLFIDEFDPHEPFDTPEPYASMYDDTWEGAHLIWPPYHAAAQRKGVLNERQAVQVRAQYGGKLTMIDKWFGKVMDALERNNVLDETAVILCTDHGHYLGERDIWGKPAVPIYEPLGHIPLMIRWPGVEAGASNALTTSVDIFATLCDIFGVEPGHRIHGKSLVPLITGEAKAVREWALLGVWGREVHLVDNEAKYARAPEDGNFPISMWSNRWTTMPVHIPNAPPNLPKPDERAFLDRMPGTRVPVIRQPFQPGDMLPHWASTRFSGNYLYRPEKDPAEEENLAGRPLERELADKLRQALIAIEAPDDQLVRLGLR
jgi:arylsulfatase A-like enzyme